MVTDKVERQYDHADVVRDCIDVNIVSADEAVYAGRAKCLIATGSQGELGIFPGHAQLLTTLVPGEIRLIGMDNSETCYYVSGGFMEVQPNVVTILADTIIRAEDIDLQRAEEAREKARKILVDHKKVDDYHTVLIELTKAMAQLRAGRRRRR